MKETTDPRSRSWLKPVDQMDLWLDNEGYYRKHTAKDGSCLFRAVSEQIFLTQIFHVECRRQLVDFMMRNERKFQNLINCPLMEYAERMYSPREWGGLVEIEAMSQMYKIDFLMFRDIEQPLEPVTHNGFDRKLMLCCSQERHYDPVYTKDYITTAAFCQSTIYELLYKRVFELKEVDYAVNKMLHDKTSRYQREHIPFLSTGFALRLEMRDNYLNVKDLLDLGITPFPYKVAKSLDVDIYRNVEYDTWNEYRKGLRYGYCTWTCQEIQVGAKCLVKHEGNTWHGHVQEMQPNKGPVVVFVEELGEMRTVPYNTLQLLTPSSPSSTLAKPVLPVKLHPLQVMEIRNAIAKRTTLKTALGRITNKRDMDNKSDKASTRNNSDEIIQSPMISSSDYSEQDPIYQEKPYAPQIYQNDEHVVSSTTKSDTPRIPNSGYSVYQEVVQPPNSLNLSQQEQGPYTQPPLAVNLMAPKSMNPDGSDLPHTDVATLRFFYNLGLDHMRMNCVYRPSPTYYVAQQLPQQGQTTLESPTLQPYESYPFQMQGKSVRGGGKRQNTFEGTPLIQHPEVTSTSCQLGAPSPTGQHQPHLQAQPLLPPNPVSIQPQVSYYQPTIISSASPECEQQYCGQGPMTPTYSYDYSYDYPLYIQSPHSVMPSSYIGPDGLIYQTAVIAAAPTILPTATQAPLTLHQPQQVQSM